MNGDKAWWLSKTMWVGIAQALVGLGGLLGLAIRVDPVALGEVITMLLVVISGGGVMAGRTAATKRINWSGRKPDISGEVGD